MKSIKYVINETLVTVNEDAVISYGVSCFDNGTEIKKITDLSPVQQDVLSLVENCNELDLDPSQLTDVAEDFIDTTINI